MAQAALRYTCTYLHARQSIAKLAAMLAALVGVGAVARPEPMVCALALVEDRLGTVGYEFHASGHGRIVQGNE